MLLPEDSLENDPDAYDDGTEPRQTYVWLAVFVIFFKELLMMLLLLHLQAVSIMRHATTSTTSGSGNSSRVQSFSERVWNGSIMCFVCLIVFAYCMLP